MKLWGKAIVTFLLLIAAYLLVGTVAYIPPEWRVAKHVQTSLDDGDLWEDYPFAIIPRGRNKMDNFTDALIVNQCIHLRSEGWKTILLMPRYDEGIYQCHNLRQAMAGNTAEGQIIHYPRYWHGSTFITRILLTSMSFHSVRYLLYVLSTALMLWCFLRLWLKVSPFVAVAIAFSLVMVNVFVMQFSVQYIQVLLIALGGMIALTYLPSRTTHVPLLFLVLGSLTAFLDLLTVPTLTLGLPLIVLAAQSDGKDLKASLGLLLKACLWWAGAYALTWASKWGIATLLTGENVFANASGQAAAWQEDSGSFIGPALTGNLGHIRWIYVTVAMVLLIAAACVWHRRGEWCHFAMYFLILLIPFAFYIIMPHHSQHHSQFCYRGLAIAIAALMMMAGTWVDWPRVKLKKHKP